MQTTRTLLFRGITLAILFGSISIIAMYVLSIRFRGYYKISDFYLHRTGSLSMFLTPERNITLRQMLYLNDSSFWHVPAHNCNSSTRLSIYIASGIKNTELRATVRETWKKRLTSDMMLRFFIGVTNYSASSSTVSDLRRESNLYDDIVILDLHDSYANLTQKSLRIMDWHLRFCNAATVLLKSDDDVFWHVERLLERLKTSSDALKEPTIFGNVQYQAKVQRSSLSKYYVSKFEYARDVFPNYATGGPGYLVTTVAVQQLLRALVNTPVFRFEDVFITGVLREASNVQIKNINGLHFYPVCNVAFSCKPDTNFLGSAQLTPQTIRSIFNYFYSVSGSS